MRLAVLTLNKLTAFKHLKLEIVFRSTRTSCVYVDPIREKQVAQISSQRASNPPTSVNLYYTCILDYS